MPTTSGGKISLPTSPVKPVENFWEHSICIYGDKGVGKTTFASLALPELLPDDMKALNFRFEFGRQNLEILQVPTDYRQRLTWPAFKEYLELFCEDEDYYLAVIDSLDKCYDACFEHVCEDMFGVTHPSDKGKDGYAIWDAIKIEFESVFIALKECGKNYCLISHQKSKTEELPDGTEYERLDLSCKPAAAKIAKDQCEFVFHYGYSGTGTKKARSTARVLTLRNANNAVECSTGRPGVFLQPDGKKLYRIEIPSIDSNVDEDDISRIAQVVQDAYDNKLYDFGRDLEEEKAQAEMKAKRQSRKANLPSSPKKTVKKKTRRRTKT